METYFRPKIIFQNVLIIGLSDAQLAIFEPSFLRKSKLTIAIDNMEYHV